MQKHRDKLNLSGVARMQVLREGIWNESVAIFKNPNFNLTASPRVKFEGESGIDAGGLSREYGSLLEKVIFSTEASLFDGTSERKLPLYSIEGIYSRLFEVVGKMVAYLIVHLDIGIPCLSQAIYQYISTGSLEVAANYCSIDDISDYEMKELINKVQNQKQQWLCPCCFNSIVSMKYWQMLNHNKSTFWYMNFNLLTPKLSKASLNNKIIIIIIIIIIIMINNSNDMKI